MIPILFSTITEGTVPTSHGIGHLTNILESTVHEVRNGEYELSFSYAANGIHADEIQVDRFVLAKPNYTDDPQLFQIYEVTGNLNGRFEVKAEHVSYTLSGKIITSGTASSCTAACLLLQGAAGNFTITTDKNVNASFKITEPSSVRSWFGGKSGSLLDVFGTGEWYYDNFDCVLKLHRGQDRGVEIRYGLNLTELSQIMNISNLATAVQGYYKAEDGTVTLGTKKSTGLTLNLAKERVIDFSSDVDPESATPIATQIDNLTDNYIANNQLDTAIKTITLNFVQQGGLNERVDLCDTVHIYFEALGISTALKCIETEWDVLNERYTKCTFGNARVDITDSLNTVQKEVAGKPSQSMMEEAIKHASELITGNLGGYVVLHDTDNDGIPNEILIMNTDDISTATKVWRWNQNGLGYSSTGYSGTYSTAITADGEIVADFIKTGTLNADLIKAGVISDVNGNSTIDMATGIASLYQLIAKRDFTIKDDNGVTKAYLSTVIDGTVVLRLLDALGQNKRLQLYVNPHDRGEIVLWDENENIRVKIYGDGGIVLTNANGDTVIDLDSNNNKISLPTGRVKAPNTFDKVYDGSLSAIGAWWTFTTDFAGLLIVGKVKSTGSRTTVLVPVEMITSTPTRFFLSDETNYTSFDIYLDNDLIKIEIAGKSSDGFVEKVYGIF